MDHVLLALRSDIRQSCQTQLKSKGHFALLRFYSLLQRFFDESWRSGEIEVVK